MNNILQTFVNAKMEFIKSNASEKSIENIYDVIYALVKIENRNFDENYLLAQAYDFIGQNIDSSKIIEKSLLGNTNEAEIEKLKELKHKIDNKNDEIRFKRYRDLREARIVKEPTILSVNDFVVTKTNVNFIIEITSKVENIVILNKNVKNEDDNCMADSILEPTIEPDYTLLLKLADYIKWLGELKDELIEFYNNSSIKVGKRKDVEQNWYDGLDVYRFWISIVNDGKFETEITIYDYLHYDTGFILTIENRTIKSIEYDGNL